MIPAFHSIRAAIVCSGVLLSGLVWPSSTFAQSDRDARWGGGDTVVRGSSEQARRLEEALERYRDIERRGGWGTFSSDLPLGPPYSYECSLLASLERRLVAEGYLRKVSEPPPPPPAPEPPKSGRRAKTPPPPPPPPPRCEYGPALTDAVRAFQADRKILGDGQVGERTRNELNRPVEEVVEILEQDLARWRTVALHPTSTYLLVTIPFFELEVFERGRQTMRIPVIVGQPSWPTPLFNDELEYIVVNPDWGIPDTIAKLEYLPQARRDPKYLARQGITDTGGGLRQKPGPRNPLGRIKFVMPNEHDVYLHDTPEQRAFTAAVRALSHGCIRLSKPMDLAHYLLRDDPQWNPRRLQEAVASGKTMQINLKEHMPVHIVYSTSRVNDEGRVELRPDVYKRNRKTARTEASVAQSSDEKVEAWP